MIMRIASVLLNKRQKIYTACDWNLGMFLTQFETGIKEPSLLHFILSSVTLCHFFRARWVSMDLEESWRNFCQISDIFIIFEKALLFQLRYILNVPGIWIKFCLPICRTRKIWAPFGSSNLAVLYHIHSNRHLQSFKGYQRTRKHK